MQHIKANDPPEVLTALPHADFVSFVDNELRGKINPAVASLLRDPVVAIRWHQVLDHMRRNAENTLASRQSEYRITQLRLLDEIDDVREKTAGAEADAKVAAIEKRLREEERVFEGRALSTRRFLSGLGDRLVEAQWCREQAVRSIIDNAAIEERTLLNIEAGRMREVIVELVEAISTHRSAINPANVTDIDEDLWSVLDDEDSEEDGNDLEAEMSIGAEVSRLLGWRRRR